MPQCWQTHSPPPNDGGAETGAVLFQRRVRDSTGTGMVMDIENETQQDVASEEALMEEISVYFKVQKTKENV